MGIFADILGALVSAPVAAAGAGTKAFGDLIQAGSKDIPTLAMAGDIISSAGEHTMAGATKIREGVAGMGDLMPHVNFASLGRSLSVGTSSLTPGSQEVSRSLASAPVIEAPAIQVAMTKYDVNPSDDFAHGITFNGKGGGVSGQMMT